MSELRGGALLWVDACFDPSHPGFVHLVTPFAMMVLQMVHAFSEGERCAVSMAELLLRGVTSILGSLRTAAPFQLCEQLLALIRGHQRDGGIRV